MTYKRTLLAVVLAAGCAHQPPAAPAAAARYTVLMSTNPAGTQVVTRSGSTLTVDFEFNDRGRGPMSHSVYTLDERGVPATVVTTGNDYFKVPIEERLETSGGTARWHNSSESGEAPAGSFYSTMYGPPEELAILARAALRNDGRLPLLPAGEATVRKVATTVLHGTTVSAYEIAGLGFSPFEVWLDEELNLFGLVSAWSSTIRAGFEGDVKAMVDAQDARLRERASLLAKQLVHHPTAGRLTITNARIFDPRTGTLSAPTTINLEGERIASVGVDQERNAADVWDAEGRVVLPGLWDMHTHLGDVDGLLNIAAGITSVRDLGNDSDTIVAMKRDIDEGRAVGPRIVLAGLVDGPGPYQGPTNILAASEEEARKAVDFFAGRGYEGLKIYSSIRPELLPLLTKYAHERGLRVSGHIPSGLRAVQAVEAGYDEIQHANMLLLNFMPDVVETRTPARFTEVARRGADLDVKSPEVQAFIALLRDRNVTIDPTVAIFENMFTARRGKVSPSYAAVADRLPPQVRRYLLSGGLEVPEGMDERYRASFQRMLDLVAEMHRGGVRVVAGTDAMQGFTLHRELELYVQAGIPVVEVLRLATLGPAELLRRDADLGTIEPGKLADLVIVGGDPTTNISDIRRTIRVIKGGKVFEPAEIYRELGVRP